MKNKVFIGCSGFSNRDWKGFFFPEDLPSKDQLTFYSQYFNSVEINSTFYRKPYLKTLQKWYDLTNENFKFFIKIPKTVTHIKRLSDTKAETEDFCKHIYSGLKEKLAGFLFQLPPSFHYNEEHLEKVVTTISHDFLNVIEFRHKSWWTEEVLAKLKERDIIFSGVSFPKDLPDDVMVNNDEFIYYRLHGVPVLFKSEYSEEEIEKLADEIKNLKQTVYVFFNNTWGVAALNNAKMLQKRLAK